MWLRGGLEVTPSYNTWIWRVTWWHVSGCKLCSVPTSEGYIPSVLTDSLQARPAHTCGPAQKPKTGRENRSWHSPPERCLPWRQRGWSSCKPCRSQSPEEAYPLLFPVSWHSPCDGAGVVETMWKLFIYEMKPTKYFSDAWIMCWDVVSALTQPAIRLLDLATEATNTVTGSGGFWLGLAACAGVEGGKRKPNTKHYSAPRKPWLSDNWFRLGLRVSLRFNGTELVVSLIRSSPECSL